MKYSVEEIERHLKRWDTSDETEGIIRQLLDEREEMDKYRRAVEEYRQAVDDGMSNAGIGVTTGDAKADLHKLLCWGISVALDPTVSLAAHQRIKEARRQAFEEAAEIAEVRGINQDCIGRPTSTYSYGRKLADEIAEGLRRKAEEG